MTLFTAISKCSNALFQFRTWMLFIGTLCISIIITAFILAFKTSNMWSGSVDDHHRRLQLISNQAFYMFAAVFAQGNPQPPVSVTLRIIHAFYLIFLVIIVVAYTSHLVALIAVTKITLPLNSFKELAESPSYKVSMPESTSLYDLFRTATAGPIFDIWDQKIKDNLAHLFPSTLEGYMRDVPYVRSSDHVIIGSTHRFDSLLSADGGCDLTLTEEKMLGGYMSMAAYKGFPHMDLFNERYV